MEEEQGRSGSEAIVGAGLAGEEHGGAGIKEGRGPGENHSHQV